MRALAPPPRGGFEWWSWFVFYIYLYQGCKLLTDGWPEASELVLIGVQTQLRTTKKSEETNYKDPKKVNGDFMLTLCWSFHCLKFWLLLLIAQVNNILEWCKSLFYISTWKFSIMLSTSYHRHFVYRRLLFMIWSSFIKKQLGYWSFGCRHFWTTDFLIILEIYHLSTCSALRFANLCFYQYKTVAN